MGNVITKFDQPIYVTRPLFPDYGIYTNRLKEIWESKWLSNDGPQHARLEDELLAYLKTPYLSLFNNGTTALTVAIQALRLQGEVITTPFSFPATTHALAWNNITPVFCDIDRETMTIDPNKIEQLITNRTTAILGVHVYGIPCHVEQIKEIADRHGLRIIYDAAHAFGTEVNGNPIGGFGDITMFSFHPTKLFHTSEGGALVYDDINLKQRIDLLKNFGIKNEFEVTMPGINGKMNELSALMGQCVLQVIDDEKKKRQKIRVQYESVLGGVDGIQIIQVGDGVEDSCQYLVVRIQADEFGASRDEVYDNLRSYNVHARKYFYPLISDYPCYHQLPTANDDSLLNAKSISDEVLCLPYYGDLTEADALKICEIIINKVVCDE